MKKTIFLLILSLTMSQIALADFELSRWKFSKDILSTQSGLTKVTIDDDIYSTSNKDLSDLRVVDKNNKETPFKLVAAVPQNQQKIIPVKILNNIHVPGRASSVTVDTGATGSLINALTIRTQAKNFQRNVTVSGGDSIGDWQVLTDNAYIYNYKDERGNFESQQTQVAFTETTYRYLKIDISDKETQPIKIEGVEANFALSLQGREQIRPSQFTTQENAQEKTTEIIADLGLAGLPISKLQLEVDQENLNRDISIYGSDDKSAWNHISRGYIFKYDTPKFVGSDLIVDFPETSYRYLKIVIVNRDNQPLTVTKLLVHTIYKELIFQADDHNAYRVFYGNAQAKSPRYDIEKYFQYLDLTSALNASLSSPQNNSAYQPEKEAPKPFSERVPYLLTGVLLFSSLLIIIIVFRFLQK